MPTKFTKVGFENPDDLIASGPTMMVLVGLSYDTFPDPDKVLIGRDFLKSCRMSYDGTTGDVEIEVMG